MTAEGGVIIDGDAFARDVGRFALLTGRTFGEELKVQGRGVMRNIVKVTPPFRVGSTVVQAKRSGEQSIESNVMRVFRGRPLVGSRRVTHLFGKPHPAAPWVVPTKEKHPDVVSIYRRHWKSNTKTRNANYKKPLYVDQAKVDALLRMLDKRVGWLGGGYGEAARGLGVELPAFMKRHSSAAPGDLQMKLEGDQLFIRITNRVSYGRDLNGYVRRVEWAVLVQREKMERQIPYLLRRHESLIN